MMKLIVFDVDGTLVDSQNMILTALETTFKLHGLSVPKKEQRLATIGLSLPDGIKFLKPELKQEQIFQIVEDYKDSFFNIRANLNGKPEGPIYMGVRKLLYQLSVRDDVILGIATGKALVGLQYTLKSHGLTHFFSNFQTSDFHPSKPDPRMLEAAILETGSINEGTVMIGDTTFDMEMAVAAGTRKIGVSWGYHSAKKLKSAGADLIVDSCDQISDAIDTLFKEI